MVEATSITEKHQDIAELNTESGKVATNGADATDSDIDAVTYACGTCRTILFKESEMLVHDTDGRIKKHNARPDKLKGQQLCSSIFLDAADWMNMPYDGETQTGKIMCPNESKCQAKLGTFAHYGAQCSCGRWMNPSY
jgi:hypothetical protein